MTEIIPVFRSGKWSRPHSDKAFRNANMRIGNVEPVSVDVVQASACFDTRRWLTTDQVHRLEKIPRMIPDRQVRALRVRSESKHAARAPENMNSHDFNPASRSQLVDPSINPGHQMEDRHANGERQ
jgi:hypothetical protein